MIKPFNYAAPGTQENTDLENYLIANLVHERVNQLTEILIYTGDSIEELKQSRGDCTVSITEE